MASKHQKMDPIEIIISGERERPVNLEITLRDFLEFLIFLKFPKKSKIQFIQKLPKLTGRAIDNSKRQLSFNFQSIFTTQLNSQLYLIIP